MKKTILAAALALAAPPAAHAQEAAPRLSLGADMVSTYLLRGINVTDGPAAQPWGSLSLGSTGLSLGFWASFAVTGRDGTVPYSDRITRRMVDEVDLMAGGARTVGPVSLGAGYIAYVFPAPELDFVTQEIYASAALESAPLAPTLTLYYDFDGGDPAAMDSFAGLYATLGAAHSLRLGVPLDLGVVLAYTNQDGMRTRAGLNDVNGSAAASLSLGPLTVTPSVNLTYVFEHNVYDPDGGPSVWAALEVKLER
ncbi:MAG TPA: hypothetical protein VFQ45_13955 [Longimicrobium sp.]|nr:hypothetical protein [Longimicrobium sp.]